MRDFTVDMLRLLLLNFKESGYYFYTFEEYLNSVNPVEQWVIFRHDVDKNHLNALNVAKIEHQMNVKGTYYFRIVNASSMNEDVIKEVASLGHEIGYHYECMAEVEKRSKFRNKTFGDLKPEIQDRILKSAFKRFCSNLEKMRRLYPVKTICMHGSPLSKWDNRELWKKYNYHETGIIGEPYFDLDFTKVFYLTDTGRRWDGEEMSLRDRVVEELKVKYSFHSTKDIIMALKREMLPKGLMVTTHPQRWSNSLPHWFTELVTQNVKNIFKKLLVR